MERHEGQVYNDTTGLSVASPTITVYHVGTVVAATIYSDEGTTTQANPFTGDTRGRYKFYTFDGDYDILVAGAGLTSYTLADITIADKKRIQGLTEYELYGILANASYNRNTAAWNRKDTGRPAWTVQLDADTAEDYLRVLRAAAAANPITWVELLRVNATGQLLAILGAVGTPSYSFTGDVNTGMFSPGADLVGLATGGAERVRFNNAYSMLLRQASFDYTVSWNNPAAARALTIPDPGGADTFAFLAASQVFTNKAGVPFDSIGGTGSNNLATTGTEFLTISGILAPNATEANVEVVMHGAGQFLGLRHRLSAAPTGAGNSHVFTIRVNGGDTAAVITINDTATTGTWTGAIAYAAGDRVCIKHTVVGTPAAALTQYALRRRESAV